MRVVFWLGVICWDLSGERVPRSQGRVVLHRGPNCEQNGGWNRLATVFSSRTIMSRKASQIRGNRHDKPYRAVSCLGLQHIKAFRKQDARRHGGEALRL